MPDRPHIVFITTDTQGQNMVSCYGERGGVETPCIDAFARTGVLFENAFCAAPVCTPARSAWYAGRHPNRNGAWTNGQALSRDVPLLAERLATAGYRPVHLGKWHLEGGGTNGRGSADGGFSEPWYDLTRFHQACMQEGPNRFGAWNRGLDDVAFCFARRVADQAIEVLETHRDGPLFLAVEFDEPHGPYICPPPYRGHFRHSDLWRPGTPSAPGPDKPRIQQEYAAFLRAASEEADDLPAYYRLYHDCNSYVDSEIGRVLAAVERLLPEDTVVIYTSDHGDHHGAHGLCAKGPTAYDATCAVPLLIRAPGGGRGVRTPALASGVDLLPTMLELVGLTELGDRDDAGVSLAPVLRGHAATVRDEVFIEYNRFGLPHDQDDGLFPIRCIRTAEWKLVVNLLDTDELYCLSEDPEEIRNRIADPACAARRDELHDRLLAWQQSTRDPFRTPLWRQRPWRAGGTHNFEGLFTTGYRDVWKDHDFHRVPASHTEETTPWPDAPTCS